MTRKEFNSFLRAFLAAYPSMLNWLQKVAEKAAAAEGREGDEKAIRGHKIAMMDDWHERLCQH